MWSIVEDVPEMATAGGARRLGAGHEEGLIGRGGDGRWIERREETRPTSTRLELRLGSEELGVAARTPVYARPMFVPQLTAEGSLGPLLAEHPVLLRGEVGAPLVVRLRGSARGFGVSHGHRI